MTATTTAPTLTGEYVLDPAHSRIGFAVRLAMVSKVRGSFNEFEGTGYFDAEQPSKSHLQLTIRVASIDTRNADRDSHLRSSDFLDMHDFPDIRFASSSIERLGDGIYRVAGDLTIRGVTVPVSLDLEIEASAIKTAQPALSYRRAPPRARPTRRNHVSPHPGHNASPAPPLRRRRPVGNQRSARA